MSGYAEVFKGEKVYILPQGEKPLEAVVTVEGTIKGKTFELFEKGLEEHGLEDLVLTCATQHAQYGSSAFKEQNIPLEEVMLLLKEKGGKSLLIGTHEKNDKLFMFKHIRARKFEGMK